jgi:hypothetical protein
LKVKQPVSTHVKVLGAIFLAMGGLGLVGAAVSSVAFGLLAGVVGASGDEGAPMGSAVLGVTGLALAGMLVLFSVPSIVCGWGLLKYRPWARILAIVLAAVALLGFPYGTVFGVYALWVLFSKQTEPLFEART